MKFQDFPENSRILQFRVPFWPHAENAYETNAFSQVFKLIFTQKSLFPEKVEISQNSHHFSKIPGISPNLVEFTKFHQFWGFGISNEYRFHPIRALKAEKVTLREVSRTAAQESPFHTKTAFPVNFLFSGGIPSFLVKSALSRSWASKKPPRTLCL